MINLSEKPQGCIHRPKRSELQVQHLSSCHLLCTDVIKYNSLVYCELNAIIGFQHANEFKMKMLMCSDDRVSVCQHTNI